MNQHRMFWAITHNPITQNRGPGGDHTHGEKEIGRLDQDTYCLFGTCSRISSDASNDMGCCKGGWNSLVFGIEVKAGELGVRFSTCEKWSRSKCQSIKMAYNALVKHKVLSWHCSSSWIHLGQKAKADVGCYCLGMETKIDKLVIVVGTTLDTLSWEEYVCMQRLHQCDRISFE